jgi:hypothetical protein
MDVAPRHTAALNIPLDHFMPGEVWIGRAAVAEDRVPGAMIFHGESGYAGPGNSRRRACLCRDPGTDQESV